MEHNSQFAFNTSTILHFSRAFSNIWLKTKKTLSISIQKLGIHQVLTRSTGLNFWAVEAELKPASFANK